MQPRERFVRSLAAVVHAQDKEGTKRFADAESVVRFCARFGTLESLVAQRESTLGSRALLRAQFLRQMANWLVTDPAVQYMRTVITTMEIRLLPKTEAELKRLYHYFVEQPLNGSPIAGLMADLRIMGSAPTFREPSDNIVAMKVLEGAAPSIEFQVLHAWLVGDFFFGLLPGLTLGLFPETVDEVASLPLDSLQKFQEDVLINVEFNTFSHALATALMNSMRTVEEFRQLLRQADKPERIRPVPPKGAKEESTGDEIARIRVPQYAPASGTIFYGQLAQKIQQKERVPALVDNPLTTDLPFGESIFREEASALAVIEAVLPAYLALQTGVSMLCQLALAFAAEGNAIKLIEDTIKAADGIENFINAFFSSGAKDKFPMIEENDLVLFANLADTGGLAVFLKFYTARRKRQQQKERSSERR
jgi:hypothetical protein